MSRRTDREQLIAQLTRELPQLAPHQVVELARKLSRAGATLQRLAELECSSEYAANDRIACPGILAKHADRCICEDWPEGTHAAGRHSLVKRIAVQAQQVERRVVKLLAPLGLVPHFQDDPRYQVLGVYRAGVSEGDKESGRERGIYVA